MDYGKAIRIVRSARGISQKALAERAKLDPSYVSQIETGAKVPSIATVENMAEVLGIPVYLLMLLGSNQNDLRGLDPPQAAELGSRLLRILIDSGGSASET